MKPDDELTEQFLYPDIFREKMNLLLDTHVLIWALKQTYAFG